MKAVVRFSVVKTMQDPKKPEPCSWHSSLSVFNLSHPITTVIFFCNAVTRPQVTLDNGWGEKKKTTLKAELM